MPEELTGPIEARYREMTPRSAQLMERAARSMARGLTRTLAWFPPYPVVFDRGSGASVYDVDGNRYLDLFCNGLSLIHGHAYPPIEDALRERFRAALPGPAPPRRRSSSPRCSATGFPATCRSGSRTPAPRRPCSRSSWRAM